MKKFIAIFVLCFAALSFGVFAQIKVNSTGKVGINNTSPTYQLDVSGNFRVNDSYYELIFNSGILYSTDYASLGDYSYRWSELYAVSPTFTYSPTIDSDAGFKTDVRDFPSVSEKINQLRAVKYKLNPDKLPQKDGQPVAPNGDIYGFIAQEMKEVFPDIVTTHKDGTLGIRYTELIPVLVKAMQEQQQVINDLKSRVEKLEVAK